MGIGAKVRKMLVIPLNKRFFFLQAQLFGDLATTVATVLGLIVGAGAVGCYRQDGFWR